MTHLLEKAPGAINTEGFANTSNELNFATGTRHSKAIAQNSGLAMSNPEQQFQAAMAAAGLTPPDAINPDGAIHRFASDGRRADDSGWYVMHPDGIPAGVFGCWRTGLQSTWCAKSPDVMTQRERDAHGQRLQAMRQQRDSERAQRQQEAATTAAARWKAASFATAHPYLSRKGIQPHGARVEGDALLIPIRDTAGTLRRPPGFE